MFQTLTRQWHVFRCSEPGHRFQKVHESRCHDRGLSEGGKRNLLIVSGVILAIAGVVLLPLPGPGSLVAVAGLALLARESLAVARVLDRNDKKRHEVTRRLQRKWRRCGRERHAVLAVSVCVLLAAGGGVFYLIASR
jgi:uncharacterized protein (TIGR02611 family)